MSKIKRWDKKNKQYVEVPGPNLIKVYNAHIGGVDLCDMLLSLYRNSIKGKKWYRRIIFHMLDLCVVNAWLLYTRSEGSSATISLCDFKHDVAIGLISADTTARSRDELAILPASVNLDARFDRVDHFPILTDVKHAQRCKGAECTRKTKFMCRKCKVYLCVDRSECFYRFHHRT